MTALLARPEGGVVEGGMVGSHPSSEGVDPRRLRRALTTLKVLLVFTVFGQRLALPYGAEPVSMVLVGTLIALSVLAYSGVLTVDRQRLMLYATACAACVAVALVVLLTVPGPISVPSLQLLVLIWFVWIFRLRNQYGAALYAPLLDFFLKSMRVLAVLGAAQFFLQFVGLRYTDYVAKYISAQYLIPHYNTSYPLHYGSTTYKANAWVMLEPSFLSQFMALGIIIAILRGARLRTILLLSLGLISALSGTGFLLLAVGLLAIAIRQPWHLRRQLVATGVAALVGLLLSPASSLLLDRLGEFGTAGTSGSSRFVEPYQLIFNYLKDSVHRQLFGGGPAATRTANLSSNNALIYPIVSKLLGEYGLIAGLLFMVFVVVAIYTRARRPVLPTVILIFLFLLSASLQQAHTVTLAWILLGAFATAPATQTSRIQAPTREYWRKTETDFALRYHSS